MEWKARAVGGLLLLGAAPVWGQVSSEAPASIIALPKVIANGARDTIVQVTNVTNATVHAQCFYVDERLLFPDLPPGPSNPPQWVVTEFTLLLTHDQPTTWAVSRGRFADPSDPTCRFFPAEQYECYGAGLDPGSVPPVVENFQGAMFCLQTDASGAPLSGNALIGEATLKDDTGNVAKYGAIGFPGFDVNDGDGTLVLGQEYGGCPATWILDHRVDGTEVAGFSGSSLRTDLTVLPCAQDLDTQIPTAVTLQFSITDELEGVFSTSTTVTCWADVALSDINSLFSLLSTPTAQTRIRPSASSSSGVLLVAEEFRSSGGVDPATASAAVNAYVEGVRASPDLITIPQ